MRLKNCHNYYDFRKLAEKRLPSPIFHYIDGAADDEITHQRNSSAYNDVDLVPNVLRGVENIDLSTTIFGKKLAQLRYGENPHQESSIYINEENLGLKKIIPKLLIFMEFPSR